jgi:hypothetical protein
VNDALAQSLSTLIGACATFVLMAAAYYFGPGRRRDRGRSHDDDDPQEDES